jgi:CRP/FNR family transcriptional regulator, cyclic AMP receptor protein
MKSSLKTTHTHPDDIKLQVLKKWNLLSDLSDDDLRELADLLELCHIKKGTYLYREGDMPDYMYFIVRGKVQSFSNTLSGRIIGGNITQEVIGLNSMMSGQPRWLSARVQENLVALRIKRDDFIAYLLTRPALLMKFMIGSDKLLNILYNRIKSSYDCSAQQRVYGMLYGLYKKFGPSLSFKMDDIASHTGLTRETTIRVMSLLRKNGIIEVSRSNIKILDAEKLRLFEQYSPQI